MSEAEALVEPITAMIEPMDPSNHPSGKAAARARAEARARPPMWRMPCMKRVGALNRMLEQEISVLKARKAMKSEESR